MKQGEFGGFEGPEPEGFSGSQFRFVVEALNHGGGDGFPGTEPIENELTMVAHRASHPFHRLDS